jgi:metal-responsive CopG/Arc/MetJ family transcriptional regulator
MKTAISIPDDVFYTAEELSQRLGLSRSELYTRAIAAFLKHQRAIGVKEALDTSYTVEESRLDPMLVQLQALSLPPEEW